MGLQVLHKTPDGHRIAVSQDALSVAQRVGEGDPTCGWSGDPRMHVMFNQLTLRWEVWRLGEDGRDRFVKSWHPSQWDARVLKYLSEHDSRSHDVLARIDKHNEAVERDRERKFTEAVAEAVDYAQHAVRRLYLPGTEAPRPRVTVSK